MTLEKRRVLYDALVELDLPGGPTVHTMNVIKGFQAIGWEVILAAPKPRGHFSVPCSLIPVFFRGFEAWNLFFYECLLLIFLIFRVISKRPHFILHRERMYSFASILIARIFRIPFFVDSNGPSDQDLVSGRIGGNANEVSKRLTAAFSLRKIWRRFELSSAAGYISNSRHWADWIANEFTFPEKNMLVLSMLVDSGRFHAMDRNKCRSFMQWPEDEIVFGYVGTFQPTHELDLMFEGVRLLAAEGVKARLLLIGKGNNYELFRKKYNAESFVTWQGWMSHEDLPEAINAFDFGLAFLKPEKQFASEAFLKIKEYLACGLPVIMGPSDPALFKDYPQGAVNFLDTLTPDSFVRTSRQLILKMEAVRAEARNAATVIRKNFSLETGMRAAADFILRQESGIRK